MKTVRTFRSLVVISAVIVLLSGCIPALNPFYTAKDITFDEQLLGEWKSKEDDSSKETWKFERGEDKSYNLAITEKDNKKATCDAHLFKLKNEWFIDLIPNDCKFAEDQSGIVAAALIPGHLLVRLSRSGSELKVAFIDYDWLGKYLKEHPKALKYHLEGKHMLLTADTQDLQRFVLQHQKEGELFQKPGEFVRQESPSK